jgi:hypothetical protein
MAWSLPWLGNQRSLKKRRPAPRWRPTLEVLEDRAVPSVSSITGNFNGTPIAAGSTVWLNSVIKVSGVGADPVTVHVRQATVSSAQFTVAVPDTAITFSSTAAAASTMFDAGSNTWLTTVPTSYQGNVFLAGAVLPAGGGLAGGIKPVTWQGDFTTDTPGITVQWKWAAAVYSSFSGDYNAVGVKPVDGSFANPYANSDHAGTPENFKSLVIGGATGGGGSNFTGSYSATKAVTPSEEVALSSLAGFVYEDDNNNGIKEGSEAAISGVLITLDGINDLGQAVHLTALTDINGLYSFTGLRPGTYTLSEDQPLNFLDGQDTIGSQGGNVGNDQFLGIVLGAGVHGVNNNFGELFRGS